jgi:hypothetical protein
VVLHESLWHPWVRMERLLRTMFNTSWDAPSWTLVSARLGEVIAERRRIARAGWFN